MSFPKLHSAPLNEKYVDEECAVDSSSPPPPPVLYAGWSEQHAGQRAVT